MKFNLAISSYVPVKRLFSIAELLIATPRRNELRDINFEKLLFLKMNKIIE